ncbi:TetR/AcrR family transcriptional regulator [Vagococcus entomophilus]|uniref:TetR family transcriptional regulator n=1 Tax=Vagococcus entomophilus TaxID=1160095 RepID=A0A430AKD2_9ENTE|nr:TetR family transcriptional regulator [Vagococcus entomophilus]
MAKKTDLRVLRTKKMILSAFIKLVEEKGYDAITIQDIADEAMINRATFYAHFKDKVNLYEYIFDTSINSLAAILDTFPLMENNRVQIKNIQLALTNVFKIIKENRHFFMILIRSNFIENFESKMIDLLTIKYEEIFSKLKITENDIEVPVDFIIEYMSSIFIGTVHWWITSKSEFPPEHMARLVIKLVGNGHLTVLGIDVEK